MPEIVERLPLFPLALVLLPGETVPLHIFEERYKTMIAECLGDEAEFGLIWLSDGGLREVGCSAAVTRVLDRAEDGRMNILAEGRRRFRLLRRVEDLPYPAGDVELVDDTPGEGLEADAEAGAATARARYADLVERVTDSRPSEAELGRLDAYAMAATVDLPLGAKQDLLELQSEDVRLARLGELLEQTMRQLDYAERAEELARSNGRARPRP